MANADLDLGRYQLGWSDEEDYVFKPKKGLNEEIVREMSAMKKEPEWMRDFRLKSLKRFDRKPMAEWFAVNMPDLRFDDIYYYIKPTGEQVKDWDQLPESIKNTYEKLGIPQAERKYLAGVTAQYECLRGSTRVWTVDGERYLKELTTGDVVYAMSEVTRKLETAAVVGGGSSGTKRVVEVTAGGRTIGASADHPFLRLGPQTGAIEWVPVKQLAVGDRVAVAADLPTTGRPVLSERVFGLGSLDGQLSATVGFATIDGIEDAGYEEVFDIEVAGHHNFVAEGFVAHNSEVVFHRNREDLEAQGVLFCDMDTAVREYPDIVQRWFGTIIPPNDNKFAALNSAVWSGGSFIYVPPGIKVDMPLQAYFRINAENMGQFERTLIIADEGAQVHYVEGCSAPVYTTDSLHSAVVELVALPGSRITYTTIQNWSNNVYNLVTKRARAEAEAHVEWIDGNIGCLAQGSRVTTPGGLKPIELVTPGERVLSYDEVAGELCFRTVKAKRFSGYQPVREVRLGQRTLRVTDNHPFFSYLYDPERAKKLGRYRLGYVRADQLDEAIVPVGSIDHGHPHKLEWSDLETSFIGGNQYTWGFDGTRARRPRLARLEETTSELMWLFGLFVGDGSIEREPAKNGGSRWGRVTFSVPRHDRARPHLVEVMGRLLPGVEPGERADGITLRWSSLELADLFELNGFASGAQRKRLPDWVLDLPEDQRLSFVAGYLDSDGCAPRGRRGFSLKSVNRALLEDVADVLTTLGIPCRLFSEQGAEGPVEILGYESVCRGSHRLDLRADPRLVARVSEPLRQAVEAQPPAGTRWFPTVGRSQIRLPESVEIRAVEVGEPLVTVPTWDIEVEGTGNFVSEGFIVHNSRLTMKYPSVYLVGPKASGEVLSVAYAGPGQHQDAGAKMIHAAPETSSTIVSKSISKDGGKTTYRGLVHVDEGAEGAKSFVRCDALLLDDESISETKPYMEVGERDARIGHEATVSKIGEDQLFYLMSRGLSETQAMGMIVNGFIEPVTRTLPMEYAVEWSRLIELQMEGAVG